MKNFFIASVALIALLIVGACNKSSQLGADLFKGDNLNLSFTDNLITVSAESENPDSVLAISYTAAGITNLTKLPLGKMYDPVFGVTDARIYLNASYPTTRLTLDAGITYILDSAMFVIAYYGANVYGDTMQKQSVNLYRLDASESLSGTNFTYYTNKTFKTDATPLGGLKNFTPKPKTKVKINDTTYYRPHIAFKLDPNFAKTLLDTSVHSVYNANAGDITKYFRGFELRAEQMNNAMLSFNIADDSSGIIMYYHKQNDTAKLIYRFGLTSTSFPSFKHDYSVGTMNKFFNGKKTASGDSLMFVQGMAGPNIKFEFPNLKKELGTTAVNRAELEFTILEDSTDKYPPVERLILTAANGVPIADLRRSFSTAVTDYGGVYSTVSGNLRVYRCNLSQHLQDMLYGRAGTILYLLSDNTRGPIPNKQETTSRVVLYGTKHSKYRAKLNLYYTKP